MSISQRLWNGLLQDVHDQSGLAGMGVAVDSSAGNPLLQVSPQLERCCTARITGVAMGSDGKPLTFTDDAGTVFNQYTWVEEERYIDDNGDPAWRDVAHNPRGSGQVGTGQYVHLAHEANNIFAAENDHVVVWAGVLNHGVLSPPNASDHEHVFYNNNVPMFIYANFSGTAQGDLNFSVVDNDNPPFAATSISGKSVLQISQPGKYLFIVFGQVSGVLTHDFSVSPAIHLNTPATITLDAGDDDPGWLTVPLNLPCQTKNISVVIPTGAMTVNVPYEDMSIGYSPLGIPANALGVGVPVAGTNVSPTTNINLTAGQFSTHAPSSDYTINLPSQPACTLSTADAMSDSCEVSQVLRIAADDVSPDDPINVSVSGQLTYDGALPSGMSLSSIQFGGSIVILYVGPP